MRCGSLRTIRKIYHGGMSRLPIPALLMAGVTAGQTGHYVAIHVPAGVDSAGVFIRYILAGEELGGVVQTRPGVDDYVIVTTHGDHAAERIKAVIYAPFCAMQTLDIPLSDNLNSDGSFRLMIPDLSDDRKDGEIQIWAKDRTSGEDVAQLIPLGAANLTTRMGGLKIQKTFPAEIRFGPCSIPGPSALIDREGFSRRPADDHCDRQQLIV